MTTDKDFKRRIRERMQKTGESYTTARARLLSKHRADPIPEGYETLAGMADDVVAAKTGRPWPEWVRWLDEREAASLPHPDIARLVREEIQDGWWSQTVTVGYERIRGLREAGQRRDGSYEANRSRTLPLAAEDAFAWLSDPELRRRWIPDDHEVRGTNPPKSVRLDWPDGTLVQIYAEPKGEMKTAIAVQHTKLPDREALETRRAYWAERLDVLKAAVGTGPEG